MGLLSCGLMWNKGKYLYQEPETREKLNQIMKKALSGYEGNYKKFFDVLSEDYKPEMRIIELKECGDNIDYKKLIKQLITYGFRPDGVAYLLNLIGEVLIINKNFRFSIERLLCAGN
jgi:hypothetical protein